MDTQVGHLVVSLHCSYKLMEKDQWLMIFFLDWSMHYIDLEAA